MASLGQIEHLLLAFGLSDLTEHLPGERIVAGPQIEFAQVVQQQQSWFGPSAPHGRDCRSNGLAGAIRRCRIVVEVEFELLGVFGQQLNVVGRPDGEVASDVMDLVLTVVLLGQLQQLLVDVVLTVVQATQGVVQAVHRESPATASTLAADVLNRSCFDTGSQSVMVSSLAAVPGSPAAGRSPVVSQ